MKNILPVLLLACLCRIGTSFVTYNGSRQSHVVTDDQRLRISRKMDKPPLNSLLKEKKDDDVWMDEEDKKLDASDMARRNTVINIVSGGLLAAIGVSSWQLYKMEVYTPSGFQRLPVTQFIAALGDPNANSGTNAQTWGLWRQDPGPRGVFLQNYNQNLVERDCVAPVGWKFDPKDWWIEEHGLIMESPDFPMPPGRYLVTGGREVTTGLTVNANGEWQLDNGATMGEVTHLPCRSARYQPLPGSADVLQASPASANPKDFPVKPGAIMPSIPGTQKQDYAVLFLIGKAI